MSKQSEHSAMELLRILYESGHIKDHYKGVEEKIKAVLYDPLIQPKNNIEMLIEAFNKASSQVTSQLAGIREELKELGKPLESIEVVGSCENMIRPTDFPSVLHNPDTGDLKRWEKLCFDQNQTNAKLRAELQEAKDFISLGGNMMSKFMNYSKGYGISSGDIDRAKQWCNRTEEFATSTVKKQDIGQKEASHKNSSHAPVDGIVLSVAESKSLFHFIIDLGDPILNEDVYRIYRSLEAKFKD